jgi:hypothetical protein
MGHLGAEPIPPDRCIKAAHKNTTELELTMNNRIVLTIGALSLIIVLMVSPQIGRGSETNRPMPTVEVADTMEQLPTDCGKLAVPIVIASEIGKGIGAWPVWVATPSDQAKGVFVFPTTHYQTNDQLPGWWVTKMGWFVAETYTGDVTIQAYNLADHSPLYFEFADELTTLVTINPAKPGGFVEGIDDWAFFPSLVWASKAGCYRIEIAWDGGMWQQVVALGSVEK